MNDNGKVDGRNPSATVRFQRFLLNKGTGISQFIDSNVATLTYTYNNNLKMDEKYRLKNPLGFQVLSYRVDPDSSAIPDQEFVNNPPTSTLVTPDSNTQTEPINSNGNEQKNAVQDTSVPISTAK